MTGCFRVFQGVFQGVFENTLLGRLGCFFPPPPPLGGERKNILDSSSPLQPATSPDPKNENTLGGGANAKG